MKIAHLLTFQKAARAGSFTRAAQEMFITQPTVTHHIQSLEYELGYELFNRSNQETRLTPEGEKLLIKVNELEAVLGEIKNIGMKPETVTGDLRAAASSVMGSYFLPPALKRYSLRYPEVSIRLIFANSYATATLVQDGGADVGFAPWAPGFSSLSFTPLYSEHCILVADPAYFDKRRLQLANQDFSQCRFIFREKGTKIHDIAMEWVKKQPGCQSMPSPIITSDMESIKNLALCGTGIAILPRCCAEKGLEIGLLKEVPVPEQLPAIEYFLIQRKNDRLSAAAALLIDEISTLKGQPEGK